MKYEILTCLYYGKNKNNDLLFRIPATNTIGTIDIIQNHKSKYSYDTIELMITNKSIDIIDDIDDKKELKKAKYLDIYKFINLTK